MDIIHHYRSSSVRADRTVTKGPVPVPVLIDRWGDQITVGEVVGKLRCSRCGQKQIQEYRIIYEGGSWNAMLGAEQGKR